MGKTKSSSPPPVTAVKNTDGLSPFERALKKAATTPKEAVDKAMKKYQDKRQRP